jgi:hypothetical protein
VWNPVDDNSPGFGLSGLLGSQLNWSGSLPTSASNPFIIVGCDNGKITGLSEAPSSLHVMDEM